MCDVFSTDSSSIISYIKIKDYLLEELNPVLNQNRPIIFLCIGTDRSSGDSLGPLIGYKLKHLCKNNIHVYGTLEDPIHAKNLIAFLAQINSAFINPYIVAIDSCLGSFSNIGKIFIKKKPLCPGLALNKQLPCVGEMSITGIVNISGYYDFLILQNTRLYTVMNLADAISKGISYFILKSFDKTHLTTTNIMNTKI